MEKAKTKKKRIQKDQKLSFGLALKNNIGNNNNVQLTRNKKTDIQKQKPKKSSVSISKINESYNADKAGDTLPKENETMNSKADNKSYYQENPSEISSLSNTNKEFNSRIINNSNNNNTNYNIFLKESQIKEEPSTRNTDNSSIIKTLETNYLKKKKPFRATGLLNKSQLKLASFIKNHKDVTLQGTKRFMDKSGEYYLKNVQMQNRRQDFKFHKRNSLNNPQNLENCLNDNLLKIKKRASKIVTLLPENSLTPIPKKDGINKTGFANGYKKKELNDAQRTAVFIRRLEYATTMKKNLMKDNGDKDYEDKVIFIQEWWRTMFKIIKLQKNLRGFIFRKKLMNNLEHQEKLYQFITEFDNICNYHLFRKFMDNLKKKRDYEKAKYMEKCEDFGEKIENLEKMHNLKNLKKCLDKWNKINKKQKN
jgi:hypothetical protein